MSKKQTAVAVLGTETSLEPTNGHIDIDAFKMSDIERVEGVENLEREDISIPRLTLVQAQSQKLPDGYEAHLGEWYNTLTGEYAPEVDAILMQLGKGRIAFPDPFAADSAPMCASDDAIMPRDEYIDTVVEGVTIGQPCADCPLSKFGTNGEKPICSVQYSYAFFDAANGLPFVASAKRTGVVAARQLNSIAKTLGRKRIIRIASKKVKGDSGTYFEPTFSASVQTPHELIELVAEMTAAMGGNIASRMKQEQSQPA